MSTYISIKNHLDCEHQAQIGAPGIRASGLVDQHPRPFGALPRSNKRAFKKPGDNAPLAKKTKLSIDLAAMATAAYLPTAQVPKGLSLSRFESPGRPSILVTNRLAAGSFGKVRKALTAGGQLLAAKELRLLPAQGKSTKVSRPAEIAAKFDILRRLHGPDFAVCMDNTAKSTFLFMQWMDAGELTDLQHAARKEGGTAAVGLFAHSAYALSGQLQRLHEELGIVCMDIKTANVLGDTRRGIMLSDFGLAQPMDPVTGRTRPEQSGGTLGYIAPEMLRGLGGSAKSDIWSLGVTLAEGLVANCPLKDLSAALHDHGPNPNQAAYRAAFHQTDHFSAWRHFLVVTADDGTQKILLSRLKPGAPRGSFDAYFYELASIDPDVCEYLLGSVLQPDPMLRADASELRRWSTGFLATCPEAPKPRRMMSFSRWLLAASLAPRSIDY